MNVDILRSEVYYSAQRSQGAGGQHVNRTNSAVTLRWLYSHSRALNDWEKSRVTERLGSRINEIGELFIRAETSRNQLSNKEEAFEKLLSLLKEAFHREKKRVPTKPTRSSQRRRLDSKTKHSDKKNQRGKKWI